ncbi:MAG: hypothetical protein WCF18_02670 [Chthoniobacteraceae bacterium]
MKALRFILFATLLATGAAAAATVASFDDITYWVGTGPNRAALIIDWNDNLPAGGASGESLAWGFRWSAGASPTGIDMIRAIADADPRLQLSIVPRGLGGTPFDTVFGLYYDLDGDGGTPTFDPVGEEGSSSDSSDHFAEGWIIKGYWAYFTGPSGQTQPTWTLSLGGAHLRTLTNNAWDGWSFDDFSGSSSPPPGLAVAALPEPGCGLLLVLGAAMLLRRK